ETPRTIGTMHAPWATEIACCVAPLFDLERFPTWRYQRGGIADGRTVQPAREWTGNLVVKLVDWVRTSERRTLDYYMIGHSAGAQFLSRVAAFTPMQARRLVMTNPSTYVAATLDVDAPYGMGRVYDTNGAVAVTALSRAARDHLPW